MENTEPQEKRKRGRPRRATPKPIKNPIGRPRNPPRTPEQRGKTMVQIPEGRKLQAYRLYQQHCDACFRQGVQPAPWQHWARDYVKATDQQLATEPWTPENRRYGMVETRFEQYTTPVDAARGRAAE